MNRWALTVIGVMGCALVSAQCTRHVSLHGEDAMVFLISTDAQAVIRGEAGYSFSKTDVAATSEALKGRAFIVDSVQIQGQDAPGGKMWIVYKRTDVHAPCATPDEYPETGGGGFAVPISDHKTDSNGVIIPDEYKWLSGTGLYSQVKTYLDSFPGRYRMELRVGSDIGNAVVTQHKGPLFWVQTDSWDSSINSNGDDPGNGDTWGSGGGFDEDGNGGGGSGGGGDDNVNNRSWWEELLIGLFQPQEESVQALQDSMAVLSDWGPIGFVSAVNDVASEYQVGPKAYNIVIPTPFGNQTMNLQPFAGFIAFARFLFAGMLWWVVIWKVSRMVREKV